MKKEKIIIRAIKRNELQSPRSKLSKTQNYYAIIIAIIPMINSSIFFLFNLVIYTAKNKQKRFESIDLIKKFKKRQRRRSLLALKKCPSTKEGETKTNLVNIW